MTGEIQKQDLLDVFAQIEEPWKPELIASLNGQALRAALFEGEFVWHKPDEEDELFFVVQGECELQFRDHSLQLSGGQLCVVPKGTLHRAVAKEPCLMLLLEPESTTPRGDSDQSLT
ncbi:MAG: hypothetical protein CSA62_09960 [Planctomycetota bacterium]|nr:MAG: hypothetical protein CSA62_09960 [Planctomycetota bacterium]